MPTYATPALQTKLPAVGTTIFTIMSALATEHKAVNLGQGFPDFNCDPELIDHVTHDHPVRDGHFYYRFAEGTLGAGPWSPAQAAPQLPITPPSALRITTVDDRGRPPAV